MKQVFAILVFGFLAHSLSAQSVLGKWKTIDDETGKENSIVEVFEKDGEIHGRIIELFRGSSEDQDPLCENCKGSKKGQPIIGMVIMEGLVESKDGYDSGSILDPNNGKIYDCKVWFEGSDTLMVRGYIGSFFKTQEWKRVK